MKAIYYRKIYPFDKTVFEEKFNDRTVPFHERIGSLKPLGRKLEGRVFKGEIKGKQFICCAVVQFCTVIHDDRPPAQRFDIFYIM